MTINDHSPRTLKAGTAGVQYMLSPSLNPVSNNFCRDTTSMVGRSSLVQSTDEDPVQRHGLTPIVLGEEIHHVTQNLGPVFAQ